MTAVDQGWALDYGPDEDDIWDDDPYGDDEPDEPDWGYLAEMQQWQYEEAARGRKRRQIRRHRAHDERLWRKRMRHRNDRFWLARNERWRYSLDDSAPF